MGRTHTSEASCVHRSSGPGALAHAFTTALNRPALPGRFTDVSAKPYVQLLVFRYEMARESRLPGKAWAARNPLPVPSTFTDQRESSRGEKREIMFLMLYKNVPVILFQNVINSIFLTFTDM